MSKLFMYGTSLEGIEQLMLMVPNFQPRRSGIVINNYFNCQGGEKDCEYISSNLKINVDSFRYKGLVRECFGKVNNYPLKERLRSLANNFNGKVLLSHQHKERFYKFLQGQE